MKPNKPSRPNPNRRPGPDPGSAFPSDYEQLPERGCEEEDAARAWLRHVEAGHLSSGS